MENKEASYVLRVMSHARETRRTRHFWLIFGISSRMQLKSLSFCGLSSLQFSVERKAGHGAPGGMSASCSVTSHTYSSATHSFILHRVQNHFETVLLLLLLAYYCGCYWDLA